ncbi:hybrid sensor histidine kinase/response regulator [Desulfopila aestuarii]|uniref:histidine kinase n=1 Tax=Desulfopila aestuarii DSM 18488 TaxID=1121416 RepID=A0A1M7YN07_9BACT|nr:ATP-binding protein [Desulfopila aestuarii]SHO53918.1 PAS domain S-box-containing protein [Desulfopila aestuarii DSM 18488]
MNKKSDFTQNTLRERAEKALSSGAFHASEALTDIQDYIHELQVYQIELEMQTDELRRAQGELEQSRDEYSELYDCAPVGYLTISSTGIILKANLTAAEMLGVDRQRLFHKPLSLYIHAEDHPLFFAVCKRAEFAEQFRSCELRLSKEDGEEFYGRLDFVPIDGITTSAYRLSLIDITEKRKTDAEKLQLEKEVLHSQKQDSLRRLAGGIAHNFNNLLAVALGSIELVELDNNIPEDVTPHLDRTRQSLLKAAELSKTMLYYLGQVPSQMRSIDLVDSLSSLLPIIRSTIHGEIDFNFTSEPGPITIKGDSVQIAQILNNLITNAVEAIGSRRGTLTVRLYRKNFNSRYSINGYKHQHIRAGNYACIEVRDTGCGMDQSTIDRAIEPFFTTNFTGRGLGLSAVSGIVELHSGYLHIMSRVGNGTTFLLYFPASFPNPIQNEKLVNSSQGTVQFISGKTFLYIDDDSIVRSLGKMMLEKRGATVLEANGGKEGVEILRANKDRIDGVILDFAMPDQDGNITLIELRQLRPNIPVLLVSGYLKSHMSKGWSNTISATD